MYTVADTPARKSRSVRRRRQLGVTLIELVIAIVVVAIAVTTVLALLSSASSNSAEALVRTQAVAIGNAYLEEALLKSFDDPDGVDGEAGRVNFDDVDDYNGVDDSGARDQLDNAIAGLGDYRVQMNVGNGNLDVLATADVKRVDITVQHGSGTTLVFSGYRTRYP